MSHMITCDAQVNAEVFRTQEQRMDEKYGYTPGPCGGCGHPYCGYCAFDRHILGKTYMDVGPLSPRCDLSAPRYRASTHSIQ